MSKPLGVFHRQTCMCQPGSQIKITINYWLHLYVLVIAVYNIHNTCRYFLLPYSSDIFDNTGRQTFCAVCSFCFNVKLVIRVCCFLSECWPTSPLCACQMSRPWTRRIWPLRLLTMQSPSTHPAWPPSLQTCRVSQLSRMSISAIITIMCYCK